MLEKNAQSSFVNTQIDQKYDEYLPKIRTEKDQTLFSNPFSINESVRDHIEQDSVSQNSSDTEIRIEIYEDFVADAIV